MRKVAGLLLAGIAAASLGGCVADGGYAYGPQYGYAEPGYAYGPDYDSYYGNADYYGSGFGWYGNYWYPGTGFFVYDRFGHQHRWNHDQENYWHNHGPRPGGPNVPWHGRPQGRWTPPPAPQGRGNDGGNGPGNGRGNGHHGH